MRVLCGRHDERVGELAAWLNPRRHMVKAIDFSWLQYYSSAVCLLGALAGGALEELTLETGMEEVNLGMLHLPRLRKLSLFMIDSFNDPMSLHGDCSRLPALHSLRVGMRGRLGLRREAGPGAVACRHFCMRVRVDARVQLCTVVQR